MTATVRPVTMCPTWCELPAGHPHLDVDSVDCYRTHRVSFGEDVRVYQDEVKEYQQETGQLRHAWINVEVTIGEGSADDAEQLARQLDAAALRLRGITGQHLSAEQSCSAADRNLAQLSAVARDYEQRVSAYETQRVDAAEAEADYRRIHAEAMLRAIADGSSTGKAEAVSDADPVVAKAFRQFKVTEALADVTRAKLSQLRSQLGFGRAVLISAGEAR